MKHLPACTSHSLAETYPDEEKPADMSDYSWRDVRVMDCADDCPRLEAAKARGVELAEQLGWK